MTMNEHYARMINRCRPGYGASCALCCGSHNYTLRAESIEELFNDRGMEAPGRTPFHPYVADFEKLFHDDMQCLHVGILPGDEGLVRCLAYEDHGRGEDLDSFFNGTCKNFYCPAWDHLSDGEVLFAARLMGDWYYYSLFINNVDSVQDFSARYGDPDAVPRDELETLKIELVERMFDEDGK